MCTVLSSELNHPQNGYSDNVLHLNIKIVTILLKSQKHIFFGIVIFLKQLHLFAYRMERMAG